MANISAWLADVSAKVPGATKVDIEAALRIVIRDFCSKSMVYVRQLTAINIVAGTASYTLTPPADCSIVGIERIEVNTQPIDLASMDLLDRSVDAWRAETGDQPNAAMVDVEKVLRFRQIPTVSYTGGLVVFVSLKPSTTTSTVPDFLTSDWFETILYGTVSYLMKVPNKPYTNIQGGEYYERMYRADLSDAKKKKIVGLTKLSIRVQDAPFSIVG